MTTLLTKRPSATMSDVLRILGLERYTGSVTLHFRDGIPATVECGRPVQVQLHTAAEPRQAAPLSIEPCVCLKEPLDTIAKSSAR